MMMITLNDHYAHNLVQWWVAATRQADTRNRSCLQAEHNLLGIGIMFGVSG